jgi:hypothetical protein
MFSRYTWFGGRRRGARRTEEQVGAFVDLHGPSLFLVAIAIVALNLLDAWFTMLFLSHGGHELNPVVQALLDLGYGCWPFLVFKTLGIGTCVLLLTVTKNFRPARIGLGFVLVGYLALLGWHLFLLDRLSAWAS